MPFILGFIIYNLLSLVLGIVCLPYLLAALIFGGPKWRQRLGWVPKAGRDINPIWVHGASVGEMGVIAPFLDQLKAIKPDTGIALSTMTDTGQKRAAELSGGDAWRFFLPLDFMLCQRLALVRLKPKALVLTETELWPNLVWLCHFKDIPVFLINARLSPKSLPFYKSSRFLFGPLLNGMQLIACQSEEDARRYSMLGVSRERLDVTGNLKYDGIKGPVPDEKRDAIRRELGFDSGEVVFTAGSTREGEEPIILEAWQQLIRNSEFRIPNSKLVIAPRHPDRFSEAEEIIKNQGLKYVKRSRQKEGQVSGDYQVLLLDTIGELVNIYAASDMAFVGGSLVPVGGHNPLEPAALGIPVIFGPHMFNAREGAEGLLACGGAVQIKDSQELEAALMVWLSDPSKRRAAGDRAREFVDARRGASQKTARMVAENLE